MAAQAEAPSGAADVALLAAERLPLVGPKESKTNIRPRWSDIVEDEALSLEEKKKRKKKKKKPTALTRSATEEEIKAQTEIEFGTESAQAVVATNEMWRLRRQAAAAKAAAAKADADPNADTDPNAVFSSPRQRQQPAPAPGPAPASAPGPGPSPRPGMRLKQQFPSPRKDPTQEQTDALTSDRDQVDARAVMLEETESLQIQQDKGIQAPRNQIARSAKDAAGAPALRGAGGEKYEAAALTVALNAAIERLPLAERGAMLSQVWGTLRMSLAGAAALPWLCPGCLKALPNFLREADVGTIETGTHRAGATPETTPETEKPPSGGREPRVQGGSLEAHLKLIQVDDRSREVVQAFLARDPRCKVGAAFDLLEEVHDKFNMKLAEAANAKTEPSLMKAAELVAPRSPSEREDEKAARCMSGWRVLKVEPPPYSYRREVAVEPAPDAPT